MMELLIMIDAAKRASAARVTAVLPFLAMPVRIEKINPCSHYFQAVANLLVAAGANRILTMDLHAQQIQGFLISPSTTFMHPRLF